MEENDKYRNKYMSADELKSRLYERFRDIGALDGLQVQLRGKLISEMFKAAAPIKENKKDKKVDSQALLLPLQASNWMVYDHLKRQGYEYSLSTFMSESNLSNPEELLSVRDILHMLGYDNQSLEYSFLYKDYIKKKKDSFLVTLLSFMLKRSEHKSPTKTETANRNQNKKDFYPSLHPSKVFGDIFNNGHPSWVEVADNEATQSLERQLQLQQEKHECEIQSLRQRLIKEIDSLHEEGQQARLEIEEAKNKLLVEKEILDIKAEKLKWKELELLRKTEHFQQEAQIGKRSSAEEIVLKDKAQEMQNWEVRLKEQQQWLGQELAKIKTSKLESDHMKTQLQHLEKSYKSLESEYTNVLQDNENLRVRLKDMADYSTIKEELAWKSKKLNAYEIEIMLLKSEMQAEKMASLDTIHKLQQQLLILNIPRRNDQLNQNSNFGPVPTVHFPVSQTEVNLSNSKQLYDSVLQRFDEQKGDMTELHQLVHDLHNRICQNPPTSNATGQNQLHPIISVPQGQPKTHQDREVHRTIAKEFSDDEYCQDKFADKPLAFIAEARKRINSLEKESEALELRYSKILSSAWTRSDSPVLQMKELKNMAVQYPILHESNSLTPATPDFHQSRNLHDFSLFDDDFSRKREFDLLDDFESPIAMDGSLPHLSSDNSQAVSKEPGGKSNFDDISQKIEISATKIPERSPLTLQMQNQVHESKDYGTVSDPNSALIESFENQPTREVVTSTAKPPYDDILASSKPTEHREDKIPSEKADLQLGSGDAITTEEPQPQASFVLNSSPFRRRRNFNISAVQGAPIVDLNAAWKRKNSKELEGEPLQNPSLIDKSSTTAEMVNSTKTEERNDTPSEDLNTSNVPKEKSIEFPSTKSTEIIEDNSPSKQTVRLHNNNDKVKSKLQLSSQVKSISDDVQDIIAISNDIQDIIATSTPKVTAFPNTAGPSTEHQVLTESDITLQSSSQTDEEKGESEAISELSEVNLSAGSVQELSKSDNDDKSW